MVHLDVAHGCGTRVYLEMEVVVELVDVFDGHGVDADTLACAHEDDVWRCSWRIVKTLVSLWL